MRPEIGLLGERLNRTGLSCQFCKIDARTYVFDLAYPRAYNRPD